MLDHLVKDRSAFSSVVINNAGSTLQALLSRLPADFNMGRLSCHLLLPATMF